MAFDANPIQEINNEIPNTIKDIDPLYLRNDSNNLVNENTADKDEQFSAIMDRYFLRSPDNPSPDYNRLINSISYNKSYKEYKLNNIHFFYNVGLKQSMCRKSRLYELYDKDE